MWNKLEDGRYRIHAAKSVLTDFLSTVPAEEGLHVGLRIYGSKVPFAKAGACEDSVLVVPVEGVERTRLLEAVQKARAVGATPLARSLELAAGDFPPEGKKTLIVCTDGEESCGGDVGAALQALKAAGVEVDVRLIGIGLPPAAAARFSSLGVPVSNINSTGAFAEAFNSAVARALPAAPRPAGEVPVTLRVVKDGAPLADARVTLQEEVSGTAVELRSDAPGVFTGVARPGSHRARVEPGGRIFEGLAVPVGEPVQFVLDLTEAPQAVLKVRPERTPGGRPVTVTFSGAAGLEGDWIGLVPAESTAEVQTDWIDVSGRKSGEITLPAPMEPGLYEARLHTKVGGQPAIGGRSARLTVEAPAVSLTVAPDPVPAVASLTVTWQGPAAAGDWIGLAAAGSPDRDYLTYQRPNAGGRPLVFTAPSIPGRYEVRYSNDQASSVFARKGFEVVPAEFSVTAPEEAMSGARVAVSWTGGEGEGIFVTIVPAEAEDGVYAQWAYVAGQEPPLHLTAPRIEGAAEVRLVAEHDGKVLARRPLRLRPAQATLQAGGSGRPGDSLTVAWTGPAGAGDFVTLVPPDAPEDHYEGYFAAEDPSGKGDGSLLLPESVGAWELRYVTGEGRVLARKLVQIE